MESAPPHLVVWDFDGTLADSYAAIRHSTDQALVAHGLPPVAESSLRGVIGLSLATAFAELIGDGKAEPDPALVAELVAGYRDAYRADGVELITLFPGIQALLVELVDAQIPLAIATSKSHRGVKQALVHLGIEDLFATVVADDDVGEKKPHPEMVLLACEFHGVAPQDTVVIGDTAYDIAMGSKAGARTIAVTWGNHTIAELQAEHPDHIAHTIPDLRTILRL
ncbi:MAG TPA: HAD family hydrolase [Acidimicrobiales bacterium]